VLEVFSAVTTLEQKGLAGYGLGQLVLQPPDLAGKNKGGQGGNGFQNRPVLVKVGPIGLLQGWKV
jgi:hypothetical protein